MEIARKAELVGMIHWRKAGAESVIDGTALKDQKVSCYCPLPAILLTTAGAVRRLQLDEPGKGIPFIEPIPDKGSYRAC